MLNLRRVINKKPVAILLPGPSIKELDDWILDLKDCDIKFATVNNFWVMEGRFLSKIGRKLDIIMCSAKENNVPTERHKEFLDRPDDNLLLTETVSFHHSLDEYTTKYPDKLCFFSTDLNYTSLQYPSKERPLHFFAQASMVILISLLLIGGSRDIFLFGADGGDRRNKGLYIDGWDSDSIFRLAYDTGFFNATMPTVLHNVATAHSIDGARIINVCMDTFYATFPVAPYDMAMTMIKKEYGYRTRV